MSPRTPVPSPSLAATGATFEDAIKRLGEIVQTLERGDLPLEESLRLFEEGVRLSRISQDRLDAAQKKVEQLLGVDEQGRARTKPFETNAAGVPQSPGEEDDIPF
ncbi:MAG TPA: exodeoxyribonuclease VII small subunit [Polyangiaceae bacterium]|jgi:exodeoxyribonuclease VII small subunit